MVVPVLVVSGVAGQADSGVTVPPTLGSGVGRTLVCPPCFGPSLSLCLVLLGNVSSCWKRRYCTVCFYAHSVALASEELVSMPMAFISLLETFL